jgi:hypothetical protein
LMSVVVCRIRPAIHAAYQAHAETIEASLRLGFRPLRHGGERLEEHFDAFR